MGAEHPRRSRFPDADEGTERNEAAVSIEPFIWNPHTSSESPLISFYESVIQKCHASREPLSASLLQQSSTLPPPIVCNLKARSEDEDPGHQYMCQNRKTVPPVHSDVDNCPLKSWGSSMTAVKAAVSNLVSTISRALPRFNEAPD